MSKPRKLKAPPGGGPPLRPAAESRLARSRGAARELQAKTPSGILHELQVYQVELEMQNEELKGAHDRVLLVLESITDAFFSLDREWRFTYLNQEAERILGQPREQLVGHNIWAVFPQAVGSGFQREYERAVAENKTARFEEFYPPFGQWFQVHAYPSATGLSVYFRDITERIRAEEALRRAHDELELRVQERTTELLQTNENLRREIERRRQTERELTEAQLRYRTVADFTYDWEYWETPDFLLAYCSPSCERITGYSADEFIAEPRLLQQIVHPEDAGNWRRCRAEWLTAPEPRVVQFRIRKKDGSVCWMEHAWQPVVGEDGVFLGIRASNRDVTQRKTAELETQRLREQLAHVTRVTTAGQLAASLAHELNQPLTGILCNAEAAEQVLASDQPDLKEVQEALSEIRSDSHRAGGVIQRLRALFTKSAQQRSSLQLNEVIEETTGLLRSELVLSGVSLQRKFAPDLPLVLGDRIGLQQVLLNLIVNALEAMAELPPASRSLLISTDHESPAMIRASFRDFGPGIPEPQLSRLFEPFFTTKAGGMGMGLAICRSIIEAHDGRLWVVNNLEQGATFHFTLPVPAGENA